MTNTLRLDRVLDLKAAQPLKAALAEHRGASVRLDASDVERLGGLCLQVLIAARRAWSEEGHDLTIEPAPQPSPPQRLCSVLNPILASRPTKTESSGDQGPHSG